MIIMDSGSILSRPDNMPLDQEKVALWDAEHLAVSHVDARPLEEGASRRSAKSTVSRFRHGIWLGLLEATFLILGLYGILRQGGVLDTATRWLAHPQVVSEKPFHVLGHAIRVKQPRSNVPTYSNQTRMLCFPRKMQRLLTRFAQSSHSPLRLCPLAQSSQRDG